MVNGAAARGTAMVELDEELDEDDNRDLVGVDNVHAFFYISTTAISTASLRFGQKLSTT